MVLVFLSESSEQCLMVLVSSVCFSLRVSEQCASLLQTPIGIARQHPQAKCAEFIQLFLDYKHKTPRIAKVRSTHTSIGVWRTNGFSCFSRCLRRHKRIQDKSRTLTSSVSSHSVLIHEFSMSPHSSSLLSVSSPLLLPSSLPVMQSLTLCWRTSQSGQGLSLSIVQPGPSNILTLSFSTVSFYWTLPILKLTMILFR